MRAGPILSLRNVSKEYRNGVKFLALRDISLDIFSGETVSIMGPSGSGKSTLLHLLGCLDKPTGGEIFLLGKDISRMGDDELSEARRDTIGFVFQSFHLAPTMSVSRNVEVPLMLQGRPKAERREIVERNLAAVGMLDKADSLPSQLSGGQKQRAAIARSLSNEPRLLLADEPTGNLDSKTSREVVGFILALCRRRGITVVFVTHDSAITRLTKRVVHIFDGKITRDEVKSRRNAAF